MHQSSPINEEEQSSPVQEKEADTLLSHERPLSDIILPATEEQPLNSPPPEYSGILDKKGQFSPEWWNDHESLADLGKTLKKFKSPEALARSYAELERMKAYPDAADEEKMDRFRQLMGIPGDPEEYRLTAPEIKEGHEHCWDQDLVAEVSRTAHKYGIPLPALQAVADVFTQAQEKHLGHETERQREWEREEQEASLDTLRQVWGARCPHKITAASSTLERLCREAGIASEILSQDPHIGSHPDFIRLLNHVGEQLGDPPLKGTNSSKATSAQEEAINMARDPDHPLHEAYMNYKHPNHEYANKLYDKAMLKG